MYGVVVNLDMSEHIKVGFRAVNHPGAVTRVNAKYARRRVLRALGTN